VVGVGPRAALEPAITLRASAAGTARVFGGLGASISLCRSGRVSEGLALSAESYAEHLRLEERMDWYPCLHRFVSGLGLAALGRFAEAADLAGEEYRKGLQEGCAEARAWFCWLHAAPVASTGHVRPAVRWGREAVALFRQLGRPHLADSAAVSLAMALALQGRGAEAGAALDEDVGCGHSRLNGVERARTRGWIALAHGDAREARRLLEEAAEFGSQIGDLVGSAAALHDLARLGYAADASAGLRELCAHVEGRLMSCQAEHAAALRAQDPVALGAVSARFADLGADLLAAEAAFDAAVSWRRDGDPRKASMAARHATVIASVCEGAVTPALRSVQPRVVLTRSERETAMLAAAGHTNREIAQLQHLSMRTVQNRLQQVYRKLGIVGREEISAALRG
jgi:DNA-binding CsgD family transcriptional regulator